MALRYGELITSIFPMNRETSFSSLGYTLSLPPSLVVTNIMIHNMTKEISAYVYCNRFFMRQCYRPFHFVAPFPFSQLSVSRINTVPAAAAVDSYLYGTLPAMGFDPIPNLSWLLSVKSNPFFL